MADRFRPLTNRLAASFVDEVYAESVAGADAKAADAEEGAAQAYAASARVAELEGDVQDALSALLDENRTGITDVRLSSIAALEASQGMFGALRTVEGPQGGRFTWSATNTYGASGLGGLAFYAADASNAKDTTGASGYWLRIVAPGEPLTPEMFGAVGDGATDDAEAIQAVLDAASVFYKPVVQFSARTYYHTATLYANTDRLTISGFGATLSSTGAGLQCALLAHGGTLSTRDAAGVSALFTSRHHGSETRGVVVAGFTVEMDANTSGGANLGLVMAYLRESKFIACRVGQTSGNGIEQRQCIDSVIEACVVDGFRNYGIFSYGSKGCAVSLCTVDGGDYGTNAQRGIVVKHNYDGDPDVGLRIEYNTLRDIKTAEYWIVGGTWYENALTDDIYVAGHERVRGVRIEHNTLEVTSAAPSVSAPSIVAGTFADAWVVQHNTFRCAARASTVFSGGALGNYADGGTRGTGHVFSYNTIEEPDAYGLALVSVKCSCKIEHNIITRGKAQYLLLAQELEAGDLPEVVYSSNTFAGALYMRSADEMGIVATSGVGLLTAHDNRITATPIDMAAALNMSLFYSEAVETRGRGNRLVVNVDAAATNHTQTSVAHIYSNLGYFTGNYIYGDAPTDVYCIQQRGAADCGGNECEIGPTATGQKRELWMVVEGPARAHVSRSVAAGVVTVYDDSGRGPQAGYRREVYSAAAPAAGTWQAGDLVRNTFGITNALWGWVCSAGGSPGTWRAVPLQGTAVADAAALTAPADIAATYTEAEVQALRDDVAALRTTVNALLAALRTSGALAT